MKKIHRLREWLTADEASNYLSVALGEDVSRADLLRLCLDGYLTISVNLVNKAKARLGRVFSHHELPKNKRRRMHRTETPDEIRLVDVHCIDGTSVVNEEGQFVLFERDVVAIDGVWDLTMKGAERLDVEQEFQKLTNGPKVELVNYVGAFLSQTNGRWAQLQDCFVDREVMLHDGTRRKSLGSYFWPVGLPAGGSLVIRIGELDDYVASMAEPRTRSDADREKLGKRERDTLLKLVLGMAIGGYAYDPEASKSSAPTQIVADLDMAGLAVSVDTVRKYLKEAEENVRDKQPKP